MPTLLIVLLGAALSAQETAQAPPTFRAGVTLVKVDVQVTEGTGRPVAGLSAGDLQVFDDDSACKIVHFGFESDPLDVLLLLDVSGSMRQFLVELAAIARTALKPLSANDRVSVAVFGRNAAIRQEFTGDFAAVQEQMRDAVHDDSVGSGTIINGNIIFGARYMAGQPVRGRRAILIVTDNEGLNYQTPDEMAVRELYAADTVLNAIVVGKARRAAAVKPGRYVNPDFTPSDVFKIAAETGGEAMEAKQAGKAFPEMIERIRSRYAIAYEAPSSVPGAFHRIRVELSETARRKYPGAVIRARAGYYALGQ